MSNKKIFIKYGDIPETENPSSDSKLVIDTENGLRSIKIKDLRFSDENATFYPTIDLAATIVAETSAYYYDTTASIVRTYNIKKAFVAYYVMGDAVAADFVVNNKAGVPLPLNSIAVDTVTTNLSAGAQIISNNSIILPRGTYRVRAGACVCARNPGRYYSIAGESVGAYSNAQIVTDIAQLTPPVRSMLVSGISYLPAANQFGKTSITSTIDGYFYICKTAEVAFRIFTTGNLCVGDGSLNKTVIPAPALSSYNHYNGGSAPIQIIIEQLSEDDIYSLLAVNYSVTI